LFRNRYLIFGKYLKEPENLLVPTIIQYELYKWICRERDESLALNVIGITEQGKVVSMDTSLALAAADVAKQYKLAMADAIIYACATLHKVQLVTSDKHFDGLPEVVFKAK